MEKVFDITNIITLESIELWTALELPPVAGLSDLHQPLEWKVPDYGVVYHTGPQEGRAELAGSQPAQSCRRWSQTQAGS